MAATASSALRPFASDLLYHQGDRFAGQKTVFHPTLETIMAGVNNFVKPMIGKEPSPILGKVVKREPGCCESFTASTLGAGAVGGSRRGNTYIDNSIRSTNMNFISTGGGGRNDDAAALCMLGTLVFLACSAVFGYCFGNLSNTKEEMEQSKIDGATIRQIDKLNPGNPHVSKIDRFYQKYMGLLDRQYNRDWYNCAMAVAALAGGAILALGAVFSSFPAMVVGGVLAAGVGGVALFKAFFSCTRKNKEKQMAEDLHDEWKQMKMVSKHNSHTVIQGPYVPAHAV